MQTAGDILVVDDEQSIVDLITEVLEDEGYTVHTALTPADARAAIVACHPDLVLLDLHLPGKTGDLLVQDLKDDGLAHIPVILMTADSHAARELSMDGIAYCLMKPFDLDELIECVAKHILRNRTV
jgi:two-component system alkaline phosphatase synthesis response regulator PhoP